MWKNFFAGLKKYFVLKGRASRAEFWSFMACALILFLGLAVIMASTAGLQLLFHKTFMCGKLSLLFVEFAAALFLELFLILPSVGVAVRRMHDVNSSGWFILIPLVNLVMWILPTSSKEFKEPEKKSAGRIVALCLIWLLFAAEAAFTGVILYRALNGKGEFSPVQILFSSFGKDKKSGVETSEKSEEIKVASNDSSSSEKKNSSSEKNDSEKSETSSPAVDPELVASYLKTMEALSGNTEAAQPETSAQTSVSPSGVTHIPLSDSASFNGSLVNQELLEDGTVVLQRKHVQTLRIDFIGDTNVYDAYHNGKVIGSIGRGQTIFIQSIIKKNFPLTTANSNDFWLEISFGTGTGFLHLGDMRDPYGDDNYSVMEQIRTPTKTWTVRKFDSSYFYFASEDIRAYPGFDCRDYMGKIEEGGATIFVDAITEETDRDSARKYTDFDAPWVRVQIDGRSGWLPGHCCRSENGGPSFPTPNEMLRLALESNS